MLKLFCLVDLWIFLSLAAWDSKLLTIFFIIHSSQCLLSYLAVQTLSNAMVQIVEFALDSEPTNDIDLISSLFYIILAPQTHYSKIKIPFYKYLKKKSFMQNSSSNKYLKELCPNLMNLSHGLNLPKTDFNKAPEKILRNWTQF